MALPTFALYPTTTNAAAPFGFGHTFAKGDVPAGSQVVAPFAAFQCTPKNAWPDGSLKFAILAGRASVTGTTPLVSQLSIGTPTAGTAIAASSISAVATIDCGTFGAVTWSGTDWASPFSTWVSGPKMSSFIYRKPVGVDAHLVAWLEVRVWSGGELEVLPWIENGYFRVAGPTNKSATYAFTLGGTQRFSAALDLKHHSRTPLISGTALSYWLGTAPGVTPRHDVAYMQATEVVPTYSVTRSATGLATLPATYTPFQAGGIIYTDNRDGPDAMSNPGYQRPIGLLGEHDVAYLVCNDQPQLLFQSVIRNGFSAGRYPVHYRDEITNRPPLPSSYTSLTVDNPDVNGVGSGNSSTPTPTGGRVASWDGAHHPSLGFMAYLVSGSYYHMETVQLVAIGNYFTINYYNFRANSAGRFIPDYGSVQTRQAAWGMRSMAQALCATPDSDTTVRNEIKGVVETVINYYHATFIAQSNNQFGIIEPGETYELGTDGWQQVAIWQQDFFTAVYGYMLAMDLPIASAVATKLAAFFQWKAKSIVGRLGTGNTAGLKFENADVYTMAVSPTALPNYQTGAGPWASDWSQISTHTYTAIPAVNNTTWNSTTPNLLGGEFTSDVWATALWGDIHPAIAYAVRFAVPGAAAAYSRMTGASNYSVITTGFAASPVWSVIPSGQTSTPGVIVTTPGPSFIWDSAPLIANSFIWDTYRGLGIPLSAVPSGGTNGASVIRALIESGDNPNSEARVRYISTPTGFASGGDTSYTSPAGAINYETYLDGASLGQATDTVGTGGGSTVTSVVVSPSTATGSTTFTAVVNGTGSPSQAVTWTRSGTAGSINASTGVWTAPSQTGSVQTITITATSTQDSSKSGTATVTIAAAVGSTVTGVTVSPASIGVVVGGSQQFAATVAGTLSPSQAVTWTVSGAASISTSGLATGPVGVYTVTATSQQNSTKAGTALFAVLAPGSASLAPDIGLNTLIVQGPVGIAPFIG